MIELKNAIIYVNNFAECMEDEGLDRDNDARHYRKVCEAAEKYAKLEPLLVFLLRNVTVKDGLGIQDVKLFCKTVKQIKAIIEGKDHE